MSPPRGIREIWLRLKKTGTEEFTRSSYFPPSTVIKKSFEKAQKESRDLDSEDVEELAKQTLLSTDNIEM